MEKLRNLFSWAFFFGAALMFILVNVCPAVIGIVLVLEGVVFAVLTIILDCFGKLNLKEQSFKLLLYSMLGIELGQLYELAWLVNLFLGVAVVMLLALVVQSAQRYEKMLDDAREIDDF